MPNDRRSSNHRNRISQLRFSIAASLYIPVLDSIAEKFWSYTNIKPRLLKKLNQPSSMSRTNRSARTPGDDRTVPDVSRRPTGFKFKFKWTSTLYVIRQISKKRIFVCKVENKSRITRL
ncbi:hypothetical protein CDAR_469741 [Caerostris darwini]|uniref:Uncharacterized protein n=1 Tax=Caerostris darwini TaxID=1538125 RepID=A0AAV4RRS9_9ARAC|nr:hypothetical protein CDAR_469741 [Caerostris darwini]